MAKGESLSFGVESLSFVALSLERKDGIARITLNRPEALNALNETLRQELEAALIEVERDDSIRVVILTGAGKAFCAGMDLKERAANPEIGRTAVRPGKGLIGALENLSKPIIAAVNGPCYTGGLELALACDMIIAAENAIFADTHARYGLVHGWGGSQRLPRLVGQMRAMKILLTCEPVEAREAERIGMITMAVPADKLLETAEGVAKKIISNSPFSIRTIKMLVRRGLRMDLASGMEMEAGVFRTKQELPAAEESKARIQSFVQREKP